MNLHLVSKTRGLSALGLGILAVAGCVLLGGCKPPCPPLETVVGVDVVVAEYNRDVRRIPRLWARADIAFKKDARVVWSERDRYGRVVGRVFVDGLDVNAEMVRQGHAWVYRQYASDESLFGLENEARAAKLGLWALSEADKMPPWEWRKARRSRPAARSESMGKPFTCGSKHYCKEMQSCKEARFYLTQCGLGRLDGDKDGVPCEAICR